MMVEERILLTLKCNDWEECKRSPGCDFLMWVVDTWMCSIYESLSHGTQSLCTFL